MNKKQKTLMLRWMRTLGATLLANLTVVMADPAAMHFAATHWRQFALTNLLIPSIVAIEKYLRDGGAPDVESAAGDSLPVS